MNSNEYSPCDYVNRVQDNQPKPLTRAYFETLLDDMNVSMLTDKVREHRPDAERYKTQLPAITWQARFGGKLRKDENARLSGLFCLDVDIHHEEEFKRRIKHEGVEEAYKWAEQEAKARAKQWAAMQRIEDAYPDGTRDLSIVAIHISPSGTGVHVVAVWDELFDTIEQQQKSLADKLGTSYDAVCKDRARIFFLTPRKDWTYIDYQTLFNDYGKEDS